MHDHDPALHPPEPSQAATVLAAALAYARRGWQVLPLWWPDPTGACACGRPGCESVAKHPIYRLVPRGLHDASSQLDTVTRWWQSIPNANVGIRTGAASNLVVLDIDGPPGRQALRSLVAAHGLFEARWARTGGGGWHAYFAHPGNTVPTSTSRVGDRLDMRGEGGYVVAPPSQHWSGRLYRWIAQPDDPAAPFDTHLPALPGWLLDVALPPPMYGSSTKVTLRARDVNAYAAAAVRQEADEVAHASDGQRNHRLNRAAFRLGQLVGAGLLDEVSATAALVDAGLAAGPGERKIRSTIERGITAGKRHPRQVALLDE